MNQNTLAELLGMSESSIGKWTLGKSMPRTMGQIEKISSIFGVEKSYFLEPDPPTVQPSTTEHPAANSYVHIPVLGAIPAGIPSEAIESVLDYEDIPADMAKHGSFYGLIARGHSMEPTITASDSMTPPPSAAPAISHGKHRNIASTSSSASHRPTGSTSSAKTTSSSSGSSTPSSWRTPASARTSHKKSRPEGRKESICLFMFIQLFLEYIFTCEAFVYPSQ